MYSSVASEWTQLQKIDHQVCLIFQISISPFSALVWPFDLDLGEVFCSRRAGIRFSSFKATGRMDDFIDHALLSQVLSLMKIFPAAPDGRVNRFLLQKTIA